MAVNRAITSETDTTGVGAADLPGHEPDGQAAPFCRPRGSDFARNLNTAVWVYDIDLFRIVMANDAALTLWQAETEAELLARDLSQNMSAAVKRRLRQYQQDFTAHSSRFSELWTVYPNGVPTSVKVIMSGIALPDARMAMICEVAGGDAGTPDNLRSTEALLHTEVMITLYGEDGHPLYMNPAARNAAPNAGGTFRNRFVSSEDYDDLLMILEERGESRSIGNVVTTSGSTWHDISAKKCLDAVTGQPAILVTEFDVSELRTARDTARYLADYDQLTGCYNRSSFYRQLDQILARMRTGSMAIAYIDLDNFKQINDYFGHEAGDDVLRATASRIGDNLSEGDKLARFGGDEFVCLFMSDTDGTEISDRIERIQQVIREPIVRGATRHLVSASIGVVDVPCDAVESAEYFVRADIALYAAKQAGRDKLMYFNDAMAQEAMERSRLEGEIRAALAAEQFELYYQPRVDAATGRIASLEALARWNHPTRGLVPPSVFIPICEDTGLIEELGLFVLHEGCRQITEWRNQGFDIGLSINISPRQFQNPNLLDTIARLSRARDFPTGCIELEVTENVLVGEVEKIACRLHEIRELGFRVAIDDFGTGYSNLSYISSFPLDCVKIDRSFVDQLPTSGPVINLIKALADQIGAITVAEGVETAEQARSLLETGCTEMQGYHFSRPVPVGSVLPLLQQGSLDPDKTARSA